jgi:hypothetical protein
MKFGAKITYIVALIPAILYLLLNGISWILNRFTISFVAGYFGQDIFYRLSSGPISNVHYIGMILVIVLVALTAEVCFSKSKGSFAPVIPTGLLLAKNLVDSLFIIAGFVITLLNVFGVIPHDAFLGFNGNFISRLLAIAPIEGGISAVLQSLIFLFDAASQITVFGMIVAALLSWIALLLSKKNFSKKLAMGSMIASIVMALLFVILKLVTVITYVGGLLILTEGDFPLPIFIFVVIILCVDALIIGMLVIYMLCQSIIANLQLNYCISEAKRTEDLETSLPDELSAEAEAEPAAELSEAEEQ